VHSHALAKTHDHGHAVTALGMAHGLAGSGSAVALIPVVGFESVAGAIVYLVLFALGTVAGMAFYGFIAGTVFGRSAERSVKLARGLTRVTGIATVIIGVVWVLR
jgi:sulfite exporter TauE/SafE